MVDSELVDYAKTQLRAGYTPAQVRQAILEADYTIEEANDAIRAAQQQLPRPAREQPQQPKPVAKEAKPSKAGARQASPFEKKRPGKPGMVLSLLGGALILAHTILLAVNNDILSPYFSSLPLFGSSSLQVAGPDLLVLNAILGAGILLGAVLSRRKSGMEAVSGVVVMLLSGMSFLNGGGYVLAVLSIIGGALILVKK